MSDTTNEAVQDTDGTLADEVTPEPEITFPEKARLFKKHATEVLHTWADNRDYCSTFDEIMTSVGLPARERQIKNGYAREIEPVAEETEAEFNAWLTKATKALHDGADRHGFGSQADDAFEDAGFARRAPMVRQQVVIEGTFKVVTAVQMRAGDDIINHLPDSHVRELVWSRWGGDDGHPWKATVDGDPVEIDRG